jgi:hypothetical protein
MVLYRVIVFERTSPLGGAVLASKRRYLDLNDVANVVIVDKKGPFGVVAVVFDSQTVLSVCSSENDGADSKTMTNRTKTPTSA